MRTVYDSAKESWGWFPGGLLILGFFQQNTDHLCFHLCTVSSLSSPWSLALGIAPGPRELPQLTGTSRRYNMKPYFCPLAKNHCMHSPEGGSEWSHYYKRLCYMHRLPIHIYFFSLDLPVCFMHPYPRTLPFHSHKRITACHCVRRHSRVSL